MAPYDSIIFDLDGTLWDASETSAAGWNAVLSHYAPASRRVSPQDLREVAGLPFHDCVRALLDDSAPAESEELFRLLDAGERRAIEADGGTLFAGVASGIRGLAQRLRLYLVSNCQSWYLESFWAHSKLRPHFRDADCHGNSRAPKGYMIAAMVARHALAAPIYIGDTVRDEEAAGSAGIAFGHVRYGFGVAINPVHAFASFPELVAWFREDAA